MKNNKVRYTCPKGHILIARIDEDEGYPPEIIDCMGLACEETATCGPAVNVDIPVSVLRKPTQTEYFYASPLAKGHVNNRGLLLFKIGEYRNEIMFTVEEGGMWQALAEYTDLDEDSLRCVLDAQTLNRVFMELHTSDDPLLIHSVLMPNGDRWDALNGWTDLQEKDEEANINGD